MSEVLFFELDRCIDVVISCFLTELSRPAREECWGVGFGHQEQGDESHAYIDEADPEGPSPIYGGDKATNCRP